MFEVRRVFCLQFLVQLLRFGTWQLLSPKPVVKFLPYLRLAGGAAEFKFISQPLP